MKTQEALINLRSPKLIPMNKIACVEPFLNSGDIVGICASLLGLDITHTGLVVSDAQCLQDRWNLPFYLS